jgi:hypothetical protein
MALTAVLLSLGEYASHNQKVHPLTIHQRQHLSLQPSTLDLAAHTAPVAVMPPTDSALAALAAAAATAATTTTTTGHQAATAAAPRKPS